MTQQLSNVSTSPARKDETLIVAPSALDNLPGTLDYSSSLSGAEVLSLERCIEIFRRTKRCNHLHTENQYPYGCGVELVCCVVCGKIKEKIPL